MMNKWVFRSLLATMVAFTLLVVVKEVATRLPSAEATVREDSTYNGVYMVVGSPCRECGEYNLHGVDWLQTNPKDNLQFVFHPLGWHFANDLERHDSIEINSVRWVQYWPPSWLRWMGSRGVLEVTYIADGKEMVTENLELETAIEYGG